MQKYYAVLDENDYVTQVITTTETFDDDYHIEIDDLMSSLVGQWYNRDTKQFDLEPEGISCNTIHVSYKNTPKRLTQKLDEMDRDIAAALESTSGIPNPYGQFLEFAAEKGIVFNTGGTCKARMHTIPNVHDWCAWTMNASFTGAGWVLDDPTRSGWFLKLDARSSIGYNEFAVYKIPAGAGAHTDEYCVFKVNASDDKLRVKNDVAVSLEGHTHNDYALLNHSHSQYVTADTVSAQIAAALAGKADADHTHDDRYYSKSEMDAKLQNVEVVSLPASGWSETAPYTQTVNVAGMKAAYTPTIDLYLASDATAAVVKSARKQYAMLDKAVSNEGSITFSCYNKKPADNFSVKVKEV